MDSKIVNCIVDYINNNGFIVSGTISTHMTKVQCRTTGDECLVCFNDRSVFITKDIVTFVSAYFEKLPSSLYFGKLPGSLTVDYNDPDMFNEIVKYLHRILKHA